MGSLHPISEVFPPMKAVAGISIPDEFALEFTRMIRQFDSDHPGCTIQIMAGFPRPMRVQRNPL
jgi:hypothetical protein